MQSLSLQKAYGQHPFYKNRLETDRLFSLPDGAVALKGELDDAIRFIEDYQLTDAPLWKKFVLQFADTPIKADDPDNGWRGEYWGKMMRGACFVYSYTRNEELYRILTDTVRDLMRMQDALGRISTYSVKNQYHGWDIWSRKYVLLGMQYYIEICRDPALVREITDCMCRQADYLLATIGPRAQGKTPITETSDYWLGMNAASLLEPIVRLYNLTGEGRYLDFATYIVNEGAVSLPEVSLFELAAEDRLDPHDYPVVKAYEMMSCFEGLLEYYRVTGVEKWRRAVVNFARRVRLTEISVIGSSGCTHELFDHTIVRETNTRYNGVMQETCVTVTWLKFCLQLLSLTGESEYADEMEISLYNAMLGSINYHKDPRNGSMPFDSYSPLLFNTRMRGVGGQKDFREGGFYGCCACIGSAGVGVIGKYAVMASEGGIAVNLYAPMRAVLPLPGGEEVTLRIETDYPRGDGIALYFEEDTPAFDLALRIPAFSERTVLKIGETQLPAVKGTYARLHRAFKKGERITLCLDMRTSLRHALPDPTDENAFYHVALRRGPVTLARDARLPGDIEEVVSFTPDDEGYIPCELCDEKTPENTVFCRVTTASGEKIPLIDYAHAGRTFDERSLLTVWLPTRKYGTVDLSLPFAVEVPNAWDISNDRIFFVNEADGLSLSKTRAESFRALPDREGYYRLLSESGRQLTVAPDGEHLVFTEEGTPFRLLPYATGRYYIVTEDGKRVTFREGQLLPPTLAAPMLLPLQVLRFKNS